MNLEKDEKFRLFIIFIALIITLTIVATAFNFRLTQAKIKTTKQLVKDTSKLFNEDEEFFDKLEPIQDSWGNNLKCEIKGTSIKHECKIISAGPDGEFETNDDIFHTNINLKSSKIGEKIGEESTKLGTGFIKGIGKAIKEEFKK